MMMVLMAIKEEIIMSTPERHDRLWKNIDWKDDKEKLAFFNHYFKNSDIVIQLIKSQVDAVKSDLVNFIENGKIKEDGKERPITMKDILEWLG